MKLYHNADISDLNKILTEGLLPIDMTGNDKWEDNHRAKNRTDVVYLFSPIGKQNSFVNYGICLIEVDIDNAMENPFEKNDVNKNSYREYIVSMVKPEYFRAIYIPEIFRDKAEKYIDNYEKIVWCKMYAEEITGKIRYGMFDVELVYAEVSDETLHQFAQTTPIEVKSYNYFRGVTDNREMIDLYNISYDILNPY